jgi:hypothetical protein
VRAFYCLRIRQIVVDMPDELSDALPTDRVIAHTGRENEVSNETQITKLTDESQLVAGILYCLFTREYDADRDAEYDRDGALAYWTGNEFCYEDGETCNADWDWAIAQSEKPNSYFIDADREQAQRDEAAYDAKLARDEEDLNRRLDGEQREREERDDPFFCEFGQYA